MSVRTRDWLKFGVLVVMAFAFGLAFASAFKLPTRGEAALTTLALQQRGTPIPEAKPAADLGEAFVAVAEHVKPAVVFIRSERRERVNTRRLPPGFEDFFQTPRRPQVEQGSGSGFIVSPDGYILTNNHVVQGVDRVKVRLLDNREFDATIVGTDPATDVAVIKIDATNLPAVRMGNADSTRIGEWVLAIGNPLGEAFTFTVTAGIVSAKGRALQGLAQSRYAIQDFIQTDAAINPGNSGGPLVNVRGEVVGINSAIASETGFYSGYGFAIPINLARTVMTQLIETGRVERSVMGILIRDASQEDALAVGLPEIRGVLVRDFSSADSPARAAGIRPGDVIVAVDGERVDYGAQLQQRIAFKKPGDVVRVVVLRRGGERQEVSVRLAPAPSDGETAARQEDRDSPAPVRIRREGPLGVGVAAIAQEDVPDGPSFAQVMRQGGALAVTSVSPEGPAHGKLFTADDAGSPDIILKVDDKVVRTPGEFYAATRGLRSGSIVTLTTLRRFGREWSGDIVRIRVP